MLNKRYNDKLQLTQSCCTYPYYTYVHIILPVAVPSVVITVIMTPPDDGLVRLTEYITDPSFSLTETVDSLKHIDVAELK